MDKVLSVIVPVYNVQKYLPQCIDSILNQTYQNLELILIDDGSPDKCPEICDDYEKKDSRVKVIHKENGGQGSARNRGLDIATGDYIAFIDSDDYVELDMFAIMVKALEETNSDMCHCGFITHTGLRTVLSDVPEENYILNSSEEILKEYFSFTFINGGPCAKIFRKKVFADLRYPEGVAREDVYIMHHAFAACDRAVHCGKCLYHYNIREGSSEHQEFDPKFLISIKIADERYEFIKKNYPNLLPFVEKSKYGSRISAIKKIVRSNSVKKYRDIYDELIKYLKDNTPPTKKYKKQRMLILYFPLIYKLEIDIKHKYRKKIKKVLSKIKRM